MRVVKLRVFLSLMISLAFFPPWNVKWTIFFLWIVISAVALTLDSMKQAVNILFSWWTVIFITLYVVSLSLFCLFLNTHYNMYIINFMILGDHDRTLILIPVAPTWFGLLFSVFASHHFRCLFHLYIIISTIRLELCQGYMLDGQDSQHAESLCVFYQILLC